MIPVQSKEHVHNVVHVPGAIIPSCNKVGCGVYSKHRGVITGGGLLIDGAAKNTCGGPCAFASCNKQTA